MRTVIVILVLMFMVGCAEEVVKYDAGDSRYRYLEVAEPNWVDKFGDTAETRILYNLSKTRVMTAMVGKRLLALENPVDPNEVVK